MEEIYKNFEHHIRGIVGDNARSFTVVFSRIKGDAGIIYTIITNASVYARPVGLLRGITSIMLGISMVTTVISTTTT